MCRYPIFLPFPQEHLTLNKGPSPVFLPTLPPLHLGLCPDPDGGITHQTKQVPHSSVRPHPWWLPRGPLIQSGGRWCLFTRHWWGAIKKHSVKTPIYSERQGRSTTRTIAWILIVRPLATWWKSSDVWLKLLAYLALSFMRFKKPGQGGRSCNMLVMCLGPSPRA